MNDILNNLLLVSKNFMREMYRKQRGFEYCKCRLFTKNKKFKETGCKRNVYQNELDK